MRKNNISSYCRETVRVYDPDRYLLSMFAPEPSREALWALFAFNYEIAKTREVVSESTLGHIRLQWWRDAIAGIYEDGRILEHEIVRALALAIEAYHLPRGEFDALLYAREFDLENVLPATLDGLINYADFTTTPLMRLALKICGDTGKSEPVRDVAVHYALVGLLRAAPFHARQGRCYLPADMMLRGGVSVEDVCSFQKKESIAGIVRDICAGRPDCARSQSFFLRACAVLTQIYFRQIQACDYDVFSARMAREPAFKVLRLVLGVKFL